VADRVRSPEKDDADFWNQPIQSSRQQPPTTRDTYEPITYHLATARDIVKHCQTVLNRRAGLLASHALIVVVRAVRYGSPGSKRCQAEWHANEASARRTEITATSTVITEGNGRARRYAATYRNRLADIVGDQQSVSNCRR
jgi:hypothetical protein